MNKKLLLFIVVVLLAPSLAAAQPERTRLDATTVAKGYTAELTDQSFRVGIGPNIFSEPSTIKLEKLTEYPALPTDKNAISAIYSYNIQMSEPRVLEKPIWLALKYDSNTANRKQIYFYSNTTSSWHAIPTSIDQQNQYARAAIHFPHTHLAVLEEKEPAGPSKITDSWGIETSAQAVVIIDDKSGQILYEKNANQKLPLASLTKIMTTLVFLETGPNFDQSVTIIAADDAAGAKLNVSAGDQVKVRDLFFATLVGSKNNAAKALARSTGLSETDFVARMNEKASELGLTNTQFVEVAGLDWRNQSSATDYARLSRHALRHLAILQGSTTKNYSFWIQNSDKSCSFKNTNKLLNSQLTITGGKTGYLPPSWGGINYNLMTKVKDSSGNEVIAVLMGNSSYYDLQFEMESFVNWGFRNYSWN